MLKNSQTILIIRSNITNSNNTRFEYKFNGTVLLKSQQIAISKISMYYSWYNISSSNNNNTFVYTWTDANGNFTVNNTVKIPDGNYSITDLNLYLKAVMLQNGHYTGTKSAPTYYINLDDNPTYYCFRITFTALPVSGSTVVKGSSSWAYPTVSSCPKITILSSNNFYKILGFSPAVYPLSNLVNDPNNLVNIKVNGNLCPEISPHTSLIFRSNMCKNNYSYPTDILLSGFSQGMSFFGELLTYEPANLQFSPITDGSYNILTIDVCNQDLSNNLKIIDPQILISVVICDI